MAKVLADLLGRSDDRLLIHTIESFEKDAGVGSVDVVLIGDIWRKSHRVMKTLGMDINDAKAYEVYRALLGYGDLDKVLKNCDYTGVIIDGRCVSFNAKDLHHDKEKAANFNNRSLKFMRQALLNEIEMRYAATAVSRDRLDQLMDWLRRRV